MTQHLCDSEFPWCPADARNGDFYKLRVKEEMVLVEPPAPPTIPDPPKVQEAPRLPPIVEPVDDDPFLPDPEPWTSLLPGPGVTPSVLPPPSYEGFVASSTLPRCDWSRSTWKNRPNISNPFFSGTTWT